MALEQGIGKVHVSTSHKETEREVPSEERARKKRVEHEQVKKESEVPVSTVFAC